MVFSLQANRLGSVDTLAKTGLHTQGFVANQMQLPHKCPQHLPKLAWPQRGTRVPLAAQEELPVSQAPFDSRGQADGTKAPPRLSRWTQGQELLTLVWDKRVFGVSSRGVERGEERCSRDGGRLETHEHAWFPTWLQQQFASSQHVTGERTAPRAAKAHLSGNCVRIQGTLETIYRYRWSGRNQFQFYIYYY